MSNFSFSSRSASDSHRLGYWSEEAYVAKTARVSIHVSRFEAETNFSKSLVMMLPTVDKKASPWSRKYSSRARIHNVVPPPDARRSASAIRPLLKQHSTAAARLPTRRDCLINSSGPRAQSVELSSTGFGVLASSAAAAMAAAAAASLARCCSVFSASDLKKSSASCSWSSGPKLFLSVTESFFCGSSSGWGPISVVPGFLPRKRSASWAMRSWSKPSSAGTPARPWSSNWRPNKSHMRPSCDPMPPHLRVRSWQNSLYFRSARHCSNKSAVVTISGSFGTTHEWHHDDGGAAGLVAFTAAATFLLPKANILPPKPKLTPHGRLYQFGQYFELEFCCICTECKLTEPLKEAAATNEGLCGAHLTSKFACAEGISPNDSKPLEPLNQQITRLSLPHDKIKFESIAFHAMPKMPLECPCVSLNGYLTLRRSHICIEGCRSSSYATRSCVGFSGFHTTSEQRRRFAGS
mmetsp:Transcript_62917/g.192463  ORF Transcript_62917/g.192463 Transcript_62917/m.192463 type:complete len:465 (+) Transcript_62917:425-1819(+)